MGQFEDCEECIAWRSKRSQDLTLRESLELECVIENWSVKLKVPHDECRDLALKAWL